MKCNGKKQTKNSKKEREKKQSTYLFDEQVLSSAVHLTKGRPFTIKL
jgi:hypothetical protein